MSYGIAPRFVASDATSFAGTKMNSGWGSMNREIIHGHAMRSTRARSRVIHFMIVVLLDSRLETNGSDETAPLKMVAGGATRNSRSAVTAQTKIIAENGSTMACGVS